MIFGRKIGRADDLFDQFLCAVWRQIRAKALFFLRSTPSEPPLKSPRKYPVAKHSAQSAQSTWVVNNFLFKKKQLLSDHEAAGFLLI